MIWQMKQRLLHKIISVLFLSAFVFSQALLFSHNHSSSFNHESSKAKTSIFAEKCKICDIQNHSHLVFESPDSPSFSLSVEKQVTLYLECYSEIKLIKSSSRSPPLA